MSDSTYKTLQLHPTLNMHPGSQYVEQCNNYYCDTALTDIKSPVIPSCAQLPNDALFDILKAVVQTPSRSLFLTPMLHNFIKILPSTVGIDVARVS